MAATSKGYPYPVSTDTPDVPRDVGALATFLNALPIMATGSYGFGNLSPATASGNATVTFPVGRFATAPVVVASVLAPTAKCSIAVISATAASCVIQAYNGDTVARLVVGQVIAGL